jgi:flagellar protein FlaI
MAIPLQLRRIYVDEVDESLELPAPSVKVKSLMGKVEEVLKSLHRGYGILIIGELREREHFEAFVHGANAGLQVLATTHANDIQSLLDRLRVFHLNDVIDLGKYVLITMEKMSSARRVKSIIYPQGFNPDPEQVSVISTIIIKLGKIKDYVSYTMQLNKLINEPPGGKNEH